jgi:hypothetical protein
VFFGRSNGTVYEGLLDWHAANLEFSMGAPLGEVCNRWWNFDDAHAYPGHHWLLRDGLGALATSLLADAGVELRAAHAASAVCARASGGVTVAARALTPGGGELTVDADAAVVALPLGVLKSGDVAFDPPISHAKRAAVARMGFGLLNKVVLEFEKAFWSAEEGRDFFGLVRGGVAREGSVGSGGCEAGGESRGECFMFWNLQARAPTAHMFMIPGSGHNTTSALRTQQECTGRAVLLGLRAGDAAHESETRSDDVVVARARAALLTIFKHVPPHVHVHVTRYVTRHSRCLCPPDVVSSGNGGRRWGAEEFSRGSYSFIRAGSGCGPQRYPPCPARGTQRVQVRFGRSR